jgi:predicted transcriptional regulator
MAKRTKAFRIPEEQETMVIAIAAAEHKTVSDVHREAIAVFIETQAADDPEFGKIVQEAAQARLEEHLEDIASLFGGNVLEHLHIPKPN